MALNVNLHFLSGISLLKDLSEPELEIFSSCLKLVKFKKGETIVTEGAEEYTMYIFKEGNVQIVSNITMKMGSDKWGEAEKSIANLDSSVMGFFGEMSLITGSPRSATIKAVTPCILYQIHKNDFDAMAENNPAIGYKVMRSIAVVLSNRVRTMNGNILKLTTALSLALSKKKR